MGNGSIAPPFLTSPLDGGQWSDTRSGRFKPGERTRSTHLIGGWVGLRAVQDAMEKINSLVPDGIQTPVTLPVVILTELSHLLKL
jgi:hypothetical protein